MAYDMRSWIGTGGGGGRMHSEGGGAGFFDLPVHFEALSDSLRNPFGISHHHHDHHGFTMEWQQLLDVQDAATWCEEVSPLIRVLESIDPSIFHSRYEGGTKYYDA